MSWSPPGPALLFCPGDRPDRFPKALARADMLIIDLEDGVPPSAKARARGNAAKADTDRTVVRVNAPGSPWWHDDLDALRAAGVSTIAVPKVASAADLEPALAFRVIGLCETAAGVLSAREIAAAPNCEALMWGAEDLAVSLGAQASRSADGAYLDTVAHARSLVLFAARAAGRCAIDAVFTDVEDVARLAVEAREGATLGFTAKACIHPDHIEPIRAAFAADPERVAWARAVVAAAEEADTPGAFKCGAEMIDAPLLARARSILEVNSR